MNAKTAVLSVLVAVTVLFVVLSMHFRARSQDAETPTETQYIINGLYQFPHSPFRLPVRPKNRNTRSFIFAVLRSSVCHDI